MKNPLLFTPGPLTTHDEVRAALNQDWGSRSPEFINLTSRIHSKLLYLTKGSDTHKSVMLQGSGTFVVEATIATLIKPTDSLLVVINGEYGRRIASIAKRLGKKLHIIELAETSVVDPKTLKNYLAKNKDINWVAFVHLETTTGIINPLTDLCQTSKDFGCKVIVDAMSSFGAYEIDLQKTPLTAVVASSNKCLHSVPGISFAIIEKSALQNAKENCASLSFDLHDQHDSFEKNGQWRFTPPVQCLAALDMALQRLEDLGGPTARLKKYQQISKIITEGMVKLGFNMTLDPVDASSVILTFNVPEWDWFDFDRLYLALVDNNMYIYPGKLTQHNTFRIGCIGEISPEDSFHLIDKIDEAMNAMKN